MSRSPQRPARRPAAGTADAQAPGPGRHQVRLICSALMLGTLLAALDQTIVATALPTPHRPPRPAGAAATRPGPSGPTTGRGHGECARLPSVGGVPTGCLPRCRINPAAG